MGSEFYKNFQIVKKIFEEADDRLKFKISKIILEGPENKLKLTKNTQPAILTLSYAIFTVLKKEFNFNFKSTKFFAGHSLGATSVHEAVYSLIMMKNNFVSASINITEMDEEAKKYPIVTKVEKDVALNSIMSNSFGFGGTNATLVFEKV